MVIKAVVHLLCECNAVGLMEERPDLLLGIIVTHVAKQQQQQQQQPLVQPVAGKAAAKTTWMYNEQQDRPVTEPAKTTQSAAVVRETDVIASPADQVTVSVWYIS